MPPHMFVQKHYDVSTDRGFQFRFHCDRCGNGFLSTVVEIRRSLTGRLFGGLGGKSAADHSQGETPHDRALRRAVAEMRPLFAQCPGCGKWVCKPVCWNPDRDKCKDCAPVLGEGDSTGEEDAHKDRMKEQAQAASIVAVMREASPVLILCPKCGASTRGGKFCPECGATLAPAAPRCASCGGVVAVGAKFCPECGAKV